MEGREEPTNNVSAVNALVISERIAEPSLISMEDEEEGVGSCEEEDPETSQNVPLGIIDVELFF